MAENQVQVHADLCAGGCATTAAPIRPGADGSRTFYSDQTMVIHQAFGAEPATASSPEMK